jgi:hypothetical protein
LFTARSVLRRYLKHEFDDGAHLLTVVIWDPWVLTLDHNFEETLHVIGSEGGN